MRKVRPMPDFEPLIDVLAALPHQDGLFNPYASTALLPTPTAYDEVGEEADAIRRSNLKRYLENVTAAGADVVLCGEAPGYQGCRFSGVAFTSEVQIAERRPELAGLELLPQARGGRRKFMREPSAQAVWEAMDRAPRPFILWNSVQLHPHTPGSPLTNRTPRREEVALGKASLLLLLELVKPRLVVAVGNTAQAALASLGIESEAVRHPAYGGKPHFLKGLETLGVIGPRAPELQHSLF